MLANYCNLECIARWTWLSIDAFIDWSFIDILTFCPILIEEEAFFLFTDGAKLALAIGVIVAPRILISLILYIVVCIVAVVDAGIGVFSCPDEALLGIEPLCNVGREMNIVLLCCHLELECRIGSSCLFGKHACDRD